MKRSRGITLLGVMAIVGNSLAVLGILFGVMAGPTLSQIGMGSQALAGARSWSGMLGLVLGIVGAIAGMGLLRLRNWARLTTIVLASYGVIAVLISMFRMPAIQPTSMATSAETTGTFLGVFLAYVMTLLMIGWSAFNAWYFLRPSVKAQFVRNGNSTV